MSLIPEMLWPMGAAYDPRSKNTSFCVWAPKAERVAVHSHALPDEMLPMEPHPTKGYFCLAERKIPPGSLYKFRLNDRDDWPDPASKSQPQGVHGPSEVVDTTFPWTDQNWKGIPLREHVFYELHVGTFTPEGTFDAAIRHLEELRQLGVTAIELMPLAQFPGNRNWGYDGAFPFAVQHSYGGVAGMQRFVDTCHRLSLAVYLDAVYNHLGPEGNYLNQFGHYFTDAYKTPWGWAVNFDGTYSDHVRHYFLENALYWQRELHLDGLRLDAIHAIRDFSATSFLEELKLFTHMEAERSGWPFRLIAESNLNDARVIRPQEQGGLGLDAQWLDDFHHCLHTLLTGERDGYYEDFGTIEQLARSFREGFVYAGEHSPFRKRRHGNSAKGRPATQFVAFLQNHDQVGNRMMGERFSTLLPFEAQKLGTAALLLSPYLPLLFMGEEYGENAPFLYFVSHGDPQLVAAVQKGRREEFLEFAWLGEAPDPQAEATFQQSKLQHGLKGQEPHRTVWELHRELLRLRRDLPALAHLSKDDLRANSYEKQKLLTVHRWTDGDAICFAGHFGKEPLKMSVLWPEGDWELLLDTASPRWRGPGGTMLERLTSTGEVQMTLPPWSLVLYRRMEAR
jgi:maltooligosyltrehalose trehalohydrolase